MKAQNLFRMLMLMVMAFSFISCTDEDDKVEVSQLVGSGCFWEKGLEECHYIGIERREICHL